MGACPCPPLGFCIGWGEGPLGDSLPPPLFPLSGSNPPWGGGACGSRGPGAGSPPPLPSLGVTGGAGMPGRLGSHDISHAPFRPPCCCDFGAPPCMGAICVTSWEGWGWLMGGCGERLRLREGGAGGAGKWLLGVGDLELWFGWFGAGRNPGLGGLKPVNNKKQSESFYVV